MADRTSSNVERNPYNNQGGNEIVIDEEEIEVILPMGEDSGLEGFLEVVEEMTYNHNENLVEQLDASELDEISSTVIDGYEATRRIKQLYKDTIILGLAADSTISAVDSGLKCGMSDYLTKPIDKNKLTTVLNDHFGSKTKDVI